ncbi:MAG: hypothetical protein ABR540_19210 [Acidimicrobiales bacterium]
MTDLVRRTRVDVLRHNLLKISQLKQTIEQPEKTNKVLAALNLHLQQLDEVRRDMLTAISKAPGIGLDDVTRDLLKTLTDAAADLGHVLPEVESCLTTATGLLRTQLHTVKDSQDVSQNIIDLAGAKFKAVNVSNYATQQKACASVFADYVDVLRGIALRDVGSRDQSGIADLFTIAEALPRFWGRVAGWRWQSVAVPSSADGHGDGGANVLRMGFPEWTVWALPLVQYGLGAVAMEKAGIISKRTSASDVACIADAAATLVTGPAYAFATLFLRLDPASVKSPDAVDARRAATIVAALERAATVDPASPLAGVAKRLLDDWVEAVGHCGGNQTVASALKDDNDIQTTVTEVLVKLREATGSLLGKEPTVLEWVARWASVEGWRDQLASGEEDAISVSAQPPVERRPVAVIMLLNAAWSYRIDMDPALPDIDRFNRLDVVDRVIVRHCLDAIEGSDTFPTTGTAGPSAIGSRQ